MPLVKCTKKSFFQDRLCQPGQVIEVEDGVQIPSHFEIIDNRADHELLQLGLKLANIREILHSRFNSNCDDQYDPDDFPNTRIISEALGFEVTRAEVAAADPAFSRYGQQQLERYVPPAPQPEPEPVQDVQEDLDLFSDIPDESINEDDLFRDDQLISENQGG